MLFSTRNIPMKLKLLSLSSRCIEVQVQSNLNLHTAALRNYRIVTLYLKSSLDRGVADVVV